MGGECGAWQWVRGKQARCRRIAVWRKDSGDVGGGRLFRASSVGHNDTVCFDSMADVLAFIWHHLEGDVVN